MLHTDEEGKIVTIMKVEERINFMRGIEGIIRKEPNMFNLLNKEIPKRIRKKENKQYLNQPGKKILQESANTSQK
jgi:hypothetical protein